MSLVSANFGYTYTGEVSTELLIKPAVMTPDVTQLFRVINGVKYKQQIGTMQPFGKILKAAQGCGAQTVTSSGNAIGSVELETVKLGGYVEQCEDEFEGKVLVELTNSGTENWDLTGTQLGRIFDQQFVEAAKRDIFRLFCFGNTASAVDYYSPLNGLWTQIIANKTGSGDSSVTEIGTINGLSAQLAYDTLKNLHNGAPNILKQYSGRKAFYVTQNFFEAYVEYYESKIGGVEAAYRDTQDGFGNQLRFRGIPVIPMIGWDNWISIDSLSGASILNADTLVLYTTPDNHIVGIENAADQESASVWYDINTKFLKMRANMRLGYVQVHSELQAITIGNETAS